MTDDRDELFNSRRPEITDADVRKAAETDRAVVSLGFLPVIGKDSHIVSLAIKHAFKTETGETVLLDRYSASVLMLVLQELEKADWRATQTTPPGQRPH